MPDREKTYKQQIRSVKAKIRLNMLAGFKEIEHVDIPEIPKERTKFPNSKNDYWWRVDLAGNYTGCVYQLAPKEKFFPHFHAIPEYLFLLSENDKLEVITEDDYWFAKNDELVKIQDGMKHAVINHSDHVIEFLVMWKGMPNGWQGTFIDKQPENEL